MVVETQCHCGIVLQSSSLLAPSTHYLWHSKVICRSYECPKCKNQIVIVPPGQPHHRVWGYFENKIYKSVG